MWRSRFLDSDLAVSTLIVLNVLGTLSDGISYWKATHLGAWQKNDDDHAVREICFRRRMKTRKWVKLDCCVSLRPAAISSRGFEVTQFSLWLKVWSRNCADATFAFRSSKKLHRDFAIFSKFTFWNCWSGQMTPHLLDGYEMKTPSKTWIKW